MATFLEPYSVTVLRDCITLQIKKGNDYQNPRSSVKQADYYPSGCKTISEIIHAKSLRIRSLLEALERDRYSSANFESVKDSAMDLINYASFLCAYADGKMDGQDLTKDALNRPRLPEPPTPGGAAPVPQYASSSPGNRIDDLTSDLPQTNNITGTTAT